MRRIRRVGASPSYKSPEPPDSMRCLRVVRLILIFAIFLLTGCAPGLVFNISEMTPDQMLQRADHVFIGVIVDQQLQAWPFFRVPGQKPGDWAVLRRRVRLENVLRGSESRKEIDIYEIFWTDGTTGDWNHTDDGERDLFLVRTENGKYHVVRDWWRSIFPIRSGAHAQLPLDESHPFWERVGLLMAWVQPDWSPALGYWHRNDPGNVLGRWRTTKILRGLLRHPNVDLRLMACENLIENLIREGFVQDHCHRGRRRPFDRSLAHRKIAVFPPSTC
jgi:hypothetical protein